MLGEAWAYYKAHNVVTAKNIINTVRQQYASNPEVNLNALFLLGQVYTEEKDFKSANNVYRLITRQCSNPRATEALYLAAEAMFSRGQSLKDNPAEARKAYVDAINYYKGVRSKGALTEALKKEMDQLMASRGRIIADSSVDAFDRRVTSLKQLMAQVEAREDLRSLALFRVAQCYQALVMPEEASVVYEYLIDKYPNDKAIEYFYDSLIQTLSARGQHEKSSAMSEIFDKKFPNSTRGQALTSGRRKTMFALKNYTEALKSYDKALTGSNTSEAVEIIEFRMATSLFQSSPSEGVTGGVSNSPTVTLEDFEKARDLYPAFAQKHTDSKIRPDALFFLGLTDYEIANRSTDPTVAKVNVEAAIKAFEEIRAKYPTYDKLPLLTFKLGYLYSYAGAYDRDAAGKLTSTNNFDKAIATFQEFTQKWPQEAQVPEALYQIGRNHVSAGRPEQAIAAYKDLIEKFPDHDLSPYAAFEIATTYAAMKKPDDMVKAFREYVQKYPKHAKVGEALFYIASELEGEKKFDEAIPAWRDIINRAIRRRLPVSDEDRNAAINAQLRVTALLAQRQDETAVVADCEQFLTKFANDPIAARAMVNEIGTIYAISPHPEAGYDKLQQLSEQYQINAPIRQAAIINIIELAVAKKDMVRANASVARLLADPDKDKLSTAGFLAIANVSLKMDKLAQARENFEQVLAKPDNDAKTVALANFGLGQTLLGLGQFDAAKAALLKATGDAHYVPSTDVELALGQVSEGKGNSVEAVEHYSNALAAKGATSFEAAFHLGNIFYKMVSDEKGNPLPADEIKKNKKQALAYYARLLFYAGPMAEEAAFRTAQCQEALGDTARACTGYQGYTKRFPER